MYDLIIIGAGPAGLTASIYASRYKLRNLVLGKTLGGVASEASNVENYPGFENITGAKLTQKMIRQAKKLGGEIKQEEVFKITNKGDKFLIKTKGGGEYQAPAIILAMGTQRRHLNIPGEMELAGKGVSYCATCDAPFFRNKTVVVIGGGDAAATAALHLAQFAKKVYIIVREEKMIAEPLWQEKIKGNPKIEVVLKTNVIKIKGNSVVSSVELDHPYKGSKNLKTEGVFVEIGSVPAVVLANQLKVKLNEHNFIKIKGDGSTNIKGVYAAGDITTGSSNLRQIITACSEGAIAATSAYLALKNN